MHDYSRNLPPQPYLYDLCPAVSQIAPPSSLLPVEAAGNGVRSLRVQPAICMECGRRVRVTREGRVMKHGKRVAGWMVGERREEE